MSMASTAVAIILTETEHVTALMLIWRLRPKRNARRRKAAFDKTLVRTEFCVACHRMLRCPVIPPRAARR